VHDGILNLVFERGFIFNLVIHDKLITSWLTWIEIIHKCQNIMGHLGFQEYIPCHLTSTHICRYHIYNLWFVEDDSNSYQIVQGHLMQFNLWF
jgi:hypothetical protein